MPGLGIGEDDELASGKHVRGVEPSGDPAMGLRGHFRQGEGADVGLVVLDESGGAVRVSAHGSSRRIFAPWGRSR